MPYTLLIDAGHGGNDPGAQIKTAKEKDIAVVCYDRMIPKADTDLYISFDNNMVGQMLGEALADSGHGAAGSGAQLGRMTGHIPPAKDSKSFR